MKTLNETQGSISGIIAEIDNSAKGSNNELRVAPDSLPIGQGGRQGDLYIIRQSTLSKGGKGSETLQLADGTSQGSRHCVQDGVSLYKPQNYGQIVTTQLGMMSVGYEIESPVRFRITHPEHAHHEYPAGIYSTYHQVDERTKKRVID